MTRSAWRCYRGTPYVIYLCLPNVDVVVRRLVDRALVLGLRRPGPLGGVRHCAGRRARGVDLTAGRGCDGRAWAQSRVTAAVVRTQTRWSGTRRYTTLTSSVSAPCSAAYSRCSWNMSRSEEPSPGRTVGPRSRIPRAGSPGRLHRRPHRVRRREPPRFVGDRLSGLQAASLVARRC